LNPISSNTPSPWKRAWKRSTIISPRKKLLGPGEPRREDWTLAGLIHDIDFGGEFKESHPEKTREALAKYGLSVSESVYDIVQAHAGGPGKPRKSKAEWSIYCADSLTGLITAVALVYPSGNWRT
jgi:predicted hydrolase (HD superfamily)